MDTQGVGGEVWVYGVFRGDSCAGFEGENGLVEEVVGADEGEVGEAEDVCEGGEDEEEGDVGEG